MHSNFLHASVDNFSLLYFNLLHAKLAPFLLHRIGNLLAFVADLFVASVSKLSMAIGAKARSGDSKYLGRRMEYTAAEILIFKACFYL